MTDKQAFDAFRKTGALLEGHFELRSKLHSNRYFQCANVLRYPRIAEKLCREVTRRAVKSGKLGKRIDGVISPAVGGIVFERVRGEGCQACAAYVLGLPERPVSLLRMKDCAFAFAKDPAPMEPAMAGGVEAVAARGLILQNVDRAEIDGVTLTGIRGRAVDAAGVACLELRNTAETETV